MKRRSLLPLAGITGAFLVLACESGSRESRVWRASDHDRGDSPLAEGDRATQVIPEPRREVPPAASSPHGGDTSEGGAVVMQVWVGKCMRCHGQIGAGDGPDSMGARNLTDPTWQASVTDIRIAETIRSGRGRMPPFPLEPAVVDGLVKLVRQMGTPSGMNRPAAPSEAAGAEPTTQPSRP